MVVLLNLVIGLGHFLVLFNTGAYLPMIPRVAGSLGVNPAYADWTQANFFLAMALAFPTATWFLNRWGEMRSLVAAFLAFALASAVCAQTSNYHWFLAARIVQGYAGGLTIPISLGVILRHYTPQRRNIGLTLWGVAAITPFTLGPTIGGWITDTLGWRWLFYLNMPIAVAVALISAILLVGREAEHRHPPLDWPGLIFLLIALAALESALNSGEIISWWRSNTIIFLTIIGAAALVFFALWEWHSIHPLLELRFLRRRNFLIGAIGLFFTALFFQGTMALYIVGFQLTMGYSAWMVGLLLLPMAIFSKLSATLTQRFLNHIDARILGMISLLGFSAGSFWVSSYNRTASFDELIWPQILVGMFLGGLFPPLIAIALSGLRGAAEMRGTAFLNLLRVSGQAMGIPIIATLFDRRTILHAHFLTENSGTITSMFNASVKSARTSDYINHHAAMLAFNEIFYIAAWGFLIVASLLLLAKRVVFAEPDVRVRQALEELVEP
ncbi:DHA2 family efflux MFS transporter permease subunit [Acidithiobacillus sp. 'AMD consortium']|jgi:DHA2 family multidrug resistance protein|uniref:DHA2 family efflux MFS transporter permease subunit n=3 Tax=Acidithiobacillaceae TaxID=225058 RepID=A0A8X8G9S8_ACIFI|nr:DHA2 family efflux MFS transporter permease subunit [Acidithiobacillus ferridurans]MBU2723375.1 DHA2 family efflux MFS transporter permease subunit [Acidithiobacillus ferridurans]MBU2726564.1 DHA2 family efflux MFS transporter permease subunit [Acidithiobacillus ferridurans]QFG79888.1 DHA2 family efflux MFS transporter permease subunit [Acidithiobacillus sp. 'AMD consortium']BBF65889.1 putative multidrug resistance protein EmrY [Acidithiobacillus ferridurans]